jgi:NADH dehydrogenase
VERADKYFPTVRRDEVKFKLIHSQGVILPEMPEALGLEARRILERRGIELVLDARVRAASPEHVYLADGRALPTRTFVCTVGTAPNPVVKRALAGGGFREASLGGRGIGVFETDATLACAGRPGYWAVGDCAAVPRPGGSGFCPPTAQFAIREAKTCARNVVAAIDGRPLADFAFKALGTLASLGMRKAVAEMFGVRLSGFVAWFAWRTIYLLKLPGFVRKLRVALDWTLDLFFPRDITQMQVFRPQRLRVHHFEPGEAIVREGQVGREFYLILEGQVDVMGAGGSGRAIARLGPREAFGEKALLEDTPRTATVRASGPVDVLVMSREDFRSMVANFPVLGDYFSTLLRERYPGETAGAPRGGLGPPS